MSLNTFSAFVDFAIRSESSGLDFFILSEAKLSGPGRDALSRFRAEAEKNVRLLRTVLRENVTELVMEPCAAVDESAYAAPEALEAGDLASALGVLARQRDFLRDAAKCVNLREVRRTFEKLADTKDRLILESKQ
ncbi:MAG: hypothetical protein HY550_02435 [Elusimicrobia bacterium]|nr:hypothetical protein [Elusimicrobiota bacterium]